MTLILRHYYDEAMAKKQTAFRLSEEMLASIDFLKAKLVPHMELDRTQVVEFLVREAAEKYLQTKPTTKRRAK